MAGSLRDCALLLALACFLLHPQPLDAAESTNVTTPSSASVTKQVNTSAAFTTTASITSTAKTQQQAQPSSATKQSSVPIISSTKLRSAKPVVVFEKPKDTSRLPEGSLAPTGNATSATGNSTSKATSAPKPTGRVSIKIPAAADIFPVLPQVLNACPEEGPGISMQTVLAMADNMEPGEVCPAVRSWRQAAPDCRVVVFTVNPRLRSVFMDAVGAPRNVHIIRTNARPPHGVPWKVWRFWVFNQFLSMCRSRLGKGAVAITDVRDALALGNVWQHPAVVKVVEGGGVLTTLDGNPKAGGALTTVAVADHKLVARAAEVCFGPWPDVLKELRGARLASSGLVIGAAGGMSEYIQGVLDAFLDRASPECWRQKGAERAVHTYLMSLAPARGQVTFPVTRMANGEAPGYTMAEARPVTIDIYGVFSVIRGDWGMHPLHIYGYSKNPYMRREVGILFECGIQPGWWGRLVHSSKRLGENQLFLLAGVMSLVVLASLGLVAGLTLPRWLRWAFVKRTKITPPGEPGLIVASDAAEEGRPKALKA